MLIHRIKGIKSQLCLLMFPIMSQKGAGIADRLSSGDEEGVNGLVSTGCLWISTEYIIMEVILIKKKRHHICHLSYSMSNSDYSLQ